MLRILQNCFRSSDYYTISFNSRRNKHLASFVRSFTAPFACHGNAGSANIYNGCRTNAAAEAPYDTVIASTNPTLRTCFNRPKCIRLTISTPAI